ncbi:MAG: polysaccharide deacetylase family protein [Dysgonamonadaceae bacterium]|jgi:peptidoglycan/xylan/chitin deacetylase (PgdA/CDA1 family)|nr:polysaccharide deacetylase family protein [Dysgonamonadaceae bacterium]
MFKAIDLFSILFNATVPLSRSNKSGNPGIVLGFDDYHPETWEQSFDLLDKYNAKVTFFVTAGSVSPFMFHAQDRGHEIGYHTANHCRLPGLSKEPFFEQTISRMSLFQGAGIELTTFAYPYGAYEPWMHDELLKYYKVVRGFKRFRLYDKQEMKSGFIHSKSIDNIRHKSGTVFQWTIDKMLKAAQQQGKIVPLTSHNISGDGWGITPERLEYVLQKGQEYGIPFYRYNDLQGFAN